MKLKLRLTKNTEAKVKEELEKRDIIISEESDLILTEEKYQSGHLVAKDDTDTVIIEYDKVLYIESVDREIIIHTKERNYRTSQRIYQLEKDLPEEKFLRISSAVIINKRAISKLRPGLSSKFYITLTNGDNVTVTRTYYYKFKDYFRI